MIREKKLTGNNSSTHFSTSNDLHSANNIQNEAHIAHKQFQDLRQKDQQLLFSSIPMTESAKLAYGLQFIFGNSDLPKATSALGLSLEASAPNYSPVPTNIDDNQSSGIQNLVSEYLKEEQNIETPTTLQLGTFLSANKERHIYDVQEPYQLNQLTPVHRNKPRLLSLHKKRNKFPKKIYFQTSTAPVTNSQHENIVFEKPHSVQDKAHIGEDIINSDPYSAHCKQYPYPSSKGLAPYSTGFHQNRHHHVPHCTNRLYRCENLAQLERYGHHRRNRLNRLKRTKNVLKNIIAGTRTASMCHKRHDNIGSGNLNEAGLNQHEYYQLGGFPNHTPENYLQTKLDNNRNASDSNLSRFLYVTDEDRKQEVLEIYNNYLQCPRDCKIVLKTSPKHRQQPIISLSQQSYEDLIQMSTINSTKPRISMQSVASEDLKRRDDTEQLQFPNKHIVEVQECPSSCDEIGEAAGHESLAGSHSSEKNWSNFSEGSYCDNSANLFKTLGTMQNSQDSGSVKIEQVNSCCKINKHRVFSSNSCEYKMGEEKKKQSAGNVLPPTKMTLTLKPIQVIKDFDNEYTDFKWPKIDWNINCNQPKEITEEEVSRKTSGPVKEKKSTSELESRKEAVISKKPSNLNSPTTKEKNGIMILNDLSITCRNEGFSNEVSISASLEEEEANGNTRFQKNEIRIDDCNIKPLEPENQKEVNEGDIKRISNTEMTEKSRVPPNDKTDIINVNQTSITETKNKSKVSLNEDIGYSLTEWFKMNELEENYGRDRDPDKEKMGGVYQVQKTGLSSELVKRNPMYENWKNKASRNKIFFTHDNYSSQKPMLSKRRDTNSIIENPVRQAGCLISTTKPIDGTVVRHNNCKYEAAQQMISKCSSDAENTLLDLAEAVSLVKNTKVLNNDITMEDNIDISNRDICFKGVNDAALYPLELSFNIQGSNNINSNYVYGVYDVRPELQEMNEALHLNNSVSILSKEVNGNINGSLRPTEKVKDFSKTTNMYSAHNSDIDLYSKEGSALRTHSPFLLSEFSASSSPLWMTSDLDSTGAGSGYNQVTTAATEVAALEGLDELFGYKNTDSKFGSYKDENSDYNTVKSSHLSTFKSFDQSDPIQPEFLSSFIDFDSTCLPNSTTPNRSLANKSFNLSKPIPRRSFRSRNNQGLVNEATKGSIITGPINLIDYPKCLFDNNLEQNKDLISGFKELGAATISMVAGTTTAVVVAAAAFSRSANKQKAITGFDENAQNSDRENTIHGDTISKPSVEPTPLTRIVDIDVQIEKEKESLDNLRNQDNEDKKFSESMLMVGTLSNNFEAAEARGEDLLPKSESFCDSEPILELYHKFSTVSINDTNASLLSTKEVKDSGSENELKMRVENSLNMKSRTQTPVVDLEMPTEKWSHALGSESGDMFSTNLKKSQVVEVVLSWQEKNTERNTISKLAGGEAVRRTKSLNTGVQSKAGGFQSIAEKTEVVEINRSKTEANKHRTWKWKQDLAVNNRLNHSEMTFVLGLTDSSLSSLLSKENMTTKYTDTFSKAQMTVDLTVSDRNEANESQL